MLLCLLAGGATAQTTYRLQPGDTISIWVSEQEDLRQEATIGPDGWISYPLAGHVKAEGLSLEDLEKALKERLAVYFKNSLNLTIMLQPSEQHAQTVYVVGDVMTPGAYPFRAGMTVLHTLSVAGGRYRAVTSATDQDRVQTVRRTIDSSREQERLLSARILRLEAEIKGDEAIATDGKTNPFIMQEQVLMDARRQALSTQSAARSESTRLDTESVTARQDQVKSVERRIELARQRYEQTKRLVEKGGAQGSLLIEREADIGELEERLGELKTDMATADRGAINDSAQYQTQMEERRTNLLVEMQEARRQLEEVKVTIADNENTLSLYGENSGNGPDDQSDQLAFTVLRTVDGQTSEFEVNEMTHVQAGDLIRVRYLKVGEAQARATGATQSGEAAPIAGTASVQSSEAQNVQ